MKTIARLILMCLAVLWVSCDRGNEAPPPTATPDTAPASPRGPLPTTESPASATVIPDSGDTSVTLRRLTQALRDHVVRTRSVPKDFEEFVARSKVSFPPPPAGQKYVIRGQEVVLIKN